VKNIMKRIALALALQLGWLCGQVMAGPTLLLDPPDGGLFAQPGQTTGWGFSITNDTNYLVVTSAAFDSASNLGVFTDFISANFFVVGPGSSSWTQDFDLPLQTGIGSFRIDPDVMPGEFAEGQIVLSYDLYSVNPYAVDFNPDRDTLSVGNLLAANARVGAEALPIPEPWSILLAGTALIGLLLASPGVRGKVSTR
jgi:hypothetical protein